MTGKQLLIILTATAVTTVQAQTVVWNMQPRQYNEIHCVTDNLYTVSQGNKIGLINANGDEIAPIENDQLTKFYEHYALLLKNDGGNERIMGCVTDDGKYYPFSNAYYTLPAMKFYSDGVIGVSDKNGKVGYIDSHGTVVTGFDGRYNKLRPFVDGYAAVFKDKKYYLINKDGEPVKFKFKKVAELYGGTNPCNGKALVWDTNGKFYEYNLRGGSGYCESIKKPSDVRSFDYLYRLQSLSGSPKDVPYTDAQYTVAYGPTPKSENGLYGFVDNDIVILPYQLHGASTFANGLSIVKKDGKLGILKLIDGQSFGLNANNKPQRYYDKDRVQCTFSIDVPGVWNNKNLNVTVTDSKGAEMDVTNNGNAYAFSVSPSGTGTQTYIVSVYGDELKLYESPVNYAFEKRERCPICHKDKQYCTGHTDNTAKQHDDNGAKQQTNEKICPTCHKPISECKYQGVH